MSEITQYEFRRLATIKAEETRKSIRKGQRKKKKKYKKIQQSNLPIQRRRNQVDYTFDQI